MKPGSLTLVYPKWIPGEHAPSGPISDLAGITVSAGGQPVAWRRDAEDMFSFRVEVPDGASELEVGLDYLAPTDPEGFSGAASTSAKLAVISWNTVLLYPAGMNARQDRVTASLRVPAGWETATALPVDHESGGVVEYAPVPLETLVDSPVLAGAFLRRIDLTPGGDVAHRLNIAADSRAALEIRSPDSARFSRLIREADALFGARHYRHYDFLLTLSDHVAHFGLEHHESSDNRVPERFLIDPDLRRAHAELLPHEMVHSWNGKYRRPAGLAAAGYQQPMRGELLWVYEGLTDYLGKVLTARSGLWTADDFRAELAMEAAMLDHRAGRRWRPLADTAIGAQVTYDTREEGRSWRRWVDFYEEGDLIWLEADVRIRQASGGQRSLEDFCRRFHGGTDGPPEVRPFTYDDLVASMNDVAPLDWRSFFDARIYRAAPRAPLGGIEGSGWRLAYTNAMPDLWKAIESVNKTTDVSLSLGLQLNEGGTVMDVIPGSPADRVGIGPTMKVIAVNGRRWTPEVLHAALAASPTQSDPIVLLVENADYFKSCSIPYHEGEKYPSLMRDADRPDLLSEITRPLSDPGGGRDAAIDPDPAVVAKAANAGPTRSSTRSESAEPGASTPKGDEPAESREDPYLWLEDVTGEKALAWVRQQNALSTRELEASPNFEPIRSRLLTILDSRDRIPYVGKHGPWYYNFWRDQDHVRGLWRRTSLAEYRKETPDWETVLDLDALAATEKENWVWKGAAFLEPDNDRCMVSLSRGGADATVRREFDLKQKAFVLDGFLLPEAKSDVSWCDRDTLYVGTDFGPGTLTESGYPRIIREWHRGMPLSEARTTFEGRPEDVSAFVSVVHDHGRVYEFAGRSVTFFTNETFVRRGDTWVRIDKPADADVSTFGSNMVLRLRSAWDVGGVRHAAGSLLVSDFDAYLRGERHLTALFTPTERRSLDSFSATRHYLILNELENVRSRPVLLRKVEGGWERTPIETPSFGTVSVDGVDAEENDDYWLSITDFLTPSSLYLGTAGEEGRVRLKALPEFFRTDGQEIQQFEAVSRDGTRIPYFQVCRKGVALDGSQPTLLYGYGGFEISEVPSYRATVGAAWLERGGVYVVANIRGGGEFGPDWHNAARKAHRQRAYDDFAAVAEDLIRRKITSPAHLGIQGGSNGGLLMGVEFTQHPELFGAVVCQVPLLDMRRYNKLLAGASWMDEFGDPDQPEDWAYIRRYSPYQNVRAGRQYPRVLFTTSTRDDRVHPGHARKMVARMKAQGHDVLYYENIEGGHGGAANNAQIAYMNALAFTFLWSELR